MNRFFSIITTIVFFLLVWMGYALKHYRDNSIEYKRQRDINAQELKLAKATITDMSTRQRDVAALDLKYTKELEDAKSKNDALRRKLDDGGRVLVKGQCPVSSTAQTSSTSGLVYDTTIELSPTSGRNILGIRAGIINDQNALRALQEYIRMQCMK